ncbi:MAG: M24 family metallopeptidase, partial [Alphaproteobacteria bacterium]
GYADVISPPGKQIIQDGDVLMLDTGATRQGYFCDFDRNFGFGAVSDEAKSAHATLYRATEAGLAAARPGVACSQVFATMAAVINQAGGSVGRYGHGFGMQLTEPPSFAAFDDTVLRAGMAVTLEPSMMVVGDRMMAHEENIIVRDGPPELLSRRVAPELPVI